MKGIEIPFGAKDSELCGWEYTIPEGMEAVVEGGKVIVRKMESEDERIIDDAIQIIRASLLRYAEYCPEADKHRKAIAYLEKQKEQRPAEWSEEDEKMRDRILEILNKYGNIPVSGGKVQLRFNKEYMWLRHLYERFSPQPHWKPSEEQMQYLLAVINDPNNAGAESCHLILESLYNNLKKL